MVSMYRLKMAYSTARAWIEYKIRARFGMATMTGVLLAFLTVAVIALALGITFGVVYLINNSLNGTLTIPENFQSAINTLESLAGTGVIVAGAVLIILIIFVLVRIFRGGGE